MLRASIPRDYHWLDPHRYSFSPAVMYATDLIVSGQTAVSFDTETRTTRIPEGFVDQMNVIYDKIDVLLAAEDLTAEDVIEVIEYVVCDGSVPLGDLARIRERRLPTPSASIHTSCVDSLLRPGALVEVAIKARRRDSGQPQRAAVRSYRLEPAHSRGTDLGSQFAEVLDAAERLLASLNADWTHVAFAMERLASGPEVQPGMTLLDRTDRIGPAAIAGARVWTDRLIRPGGLVQLDLLIADEPVKVIPSVGGPDRPATLAAAARTGERIYISGQHGCSESSDVEKEVLSAYQRMLDVLSDAGGSAKNLLETIEYVTADGLSHYSRTADVRRRLLPLPFCAATGTVCASVGRTPHRFMLHATAAA